MTEHFPLVVIGAGPAGMAAATVASAHGLPVMVLDDQISPGGQVYRNVSISKLSQPSALLGAEYAAGGMQVDRFLSSAAQYIPESTVWNVDHGCNISYLRNDTSCEVNAGQLILSVGTQERPMPFPGWQLPGVMTAGAAQIMLKSQAMLPKTPPILVGSGPLLLLLAWQYLNAGLKVKAIVDTTPFRHYLRASRYLPGALFAGQPLIKGLGLIRAIKAAGIPVYRGARSIHVLDNTSGEASGETRARQITFSAGGRQHKINTETVLIHQGVIPQLQLAKLAGCNLTYEQTQKCWSVLADQYGESSQPNIYVAGDGQEVNGADMAVISGKLCALSVLRKTDRIDQMTLNQLAEPLLAEKRKLGKTRRFIDALYCPDQDFVVPSDDTMICRCEEVSAATIRQIARQGCQGPNQAKSFSRCGMGHCQGRFCEATVTALIAEEQNRRIEEVGYYRVRPPIKPLTLGQLGRAEKAVEDTIL